MNGVALAHGGDRAANCRFWSDVAGHQAASCAGETAVGEERHSFGKLGDARDGGGDEQHLAHARAALRAFIANDDNVVRLDLAGLDGVQSVFFGVEDARRAAMLQALVSGDLDDAAVGSEIAFEDDESAGWLDGIAQRVDDYLAGSFDGERGFLGERAAGNIGRAAVDQARVEQALGEQAAAAGVLIVGRNVVAAGLEIADAAACVALMRSKSSIESAMPISCAMARK